MFSKGKKGLRSRGSTVGRDVKIGSIGDFKFQLPPEAPVFEPTKEEFQDPMKYIKSIRHLGEQSGICKIKPPPDWQPPFAVDVDKFKFTPRIQRLNELEANTRVKLYFLDQIAKFWELQGISLKVPVVGKNALDLYTLYSIVKDEGFSFFVKRALVLGGAEVVTKEKKWNKIALKMGLRHGKDLGSLLMYHYERILYPYVALSDGSGLGQVKVEPETEDGNKHYRGYKPHGIASRQAIKHSYKKRQSRNSSDFAKGEIQTRDGPKENRELRRLQFHGAGPKMAGYQPKRGRKPKRKTRKKDLNDLLEAYVCHICTSGAAEESLLLCDGCDDCYHTFCLVPPLPAIPEGDWICPKCVAKEVSKPREAFGFEQAQSEYTLEQFGEMADRFKSDYFKMAVHEVPTSLVEREFWRIVSSVEEDVTVLYGADLHAMDHGSGFPTKKISGKIFDVDNAYVHSGWNLNNLPKLAGSVFGHMNADISGIKVPWMYVGMCFSTFCWHNEDHWSYSINYLHWGEPKTWYGVPGDKAECFEEAMKQAAPELFESQPDLLHQLVTNMNPNILMKRGVPVYRTDQQAGEFVVTFPRAYHAGFNQGFNFAEAVNFAPADWLKLGRECVNHYSDLHRFCVFSHDELVCNMAMHSDDLEATVAKAAYQDMIEMVESERKLRESVFKWGTTKAKPEIFESLPDDARQCEICGTTCFLSAVSCRCSKDKLACLRHFSELCSHSPKVHTLRYRFTMDELRKMLNALKYSAESFNTWISALQDVLDVRTPKRDLSVLKALVEEAEEKEFPHTELLKSVQEIVTESERLQTLAQSLCSILVGTRKKEDLQHKLNISTNELRQFLKKIEKLPVILKETEAVRDLLEQLETFKETSARLLNVQLPPAKDLAECLELGYSLDINLPELSRLKELHLQMQWYEDVKQYQSEPEQLTTAVLKQLLASAVEIPTHPLLEKTVSEIKDLLDRVECWEEVAKQNLQKCPDLELRMIKALLKSAENIPAHLPSKARVQDLFRKGNEWMRKAHEILESGHFPYIDAMNDLVQLAHSIPLHLGRVPELEEYLHEALSWKKRAAQIFLRKNSRWTLMNALSPREAVGLEALHLKERRYKEETESSPVSHVVGGVKLEGDLDTNTVAMAFKNAEEKEKASMLKLRQENIVKIQTDLGDARYCLCRRPRAGVMLQCELCKDLFHTKCVPQPKPSNTSKTTQSYKTSDAPGTAGSTLEDIKYLCPCCVRSRRPRLEAIQSLIEAISDFPIRMPEAEALQCLTDRAIKWHYRAREALESEELASALAKLSLHSQKVEEAALHEDQEQIIDSEVKTVSSEEERNARRRSGSAVHGLERKNGSVPSTLNAVSGGNAYSYSISDHCYSAVSRNPLASSKMYAPKTALRQPQLEMPYIMLSKEALEQLDQLMMEGDLMELSLDYTHHMWRILKANRPPNDDIYPNFCDLHSSAQMGHLQCEGQERHKRKKESPVEFVQPSCSNYRTIPVSKDGSKMRGKKEVKKKGRQDLREPSKKRQVKHELCTSLNTSAVSLNTSAVSLNTSAVSLNTSAVEMPVEEEDCFAAVCLRPTGLEVQWVQCDGVCNKWFHLVCEGLEKNDINEMEDYICNMCRAKSTSFDHPPARVVFSESVSRDPLRAKSSETNSRGPLSAEFSQSISRGFSRIKSTDTLSAASSRSSSRNTRSVQFSQSWFSDSPSVQLSGDRPPGHVVLSQVKVEHPSEAEAMVLDEDMTLAHRGARDGSRYHVTFSQEPPAVFKIECMSDEGEYTTDSADEIVSPSNEHM